MLDRSGHYITNNHVVADAVEHDGPIEIVDQNGDKYDAKVVGRSPTYDLAVLYVKGGPLAAAREPRLRAGAARRRPGGRVRLPARAELDGDLRHRQRPEPAGDDQRHRRRLVLHQRRADRRRDQPRQLRRPAGRPDRARGRGELRDRDHRRQPAGEAGNIGVGFAIPIDQVKITADQILRTGEARYPVIGASVDTGGTTDAGRQDPQGELRQPGRRRPGCRRATWSPRSQGEKVPDGIALIVAIRAHQPGETVAFTVRRGGSEMRLRITLGLAGRLGESAAVGLGPVSAFAVALGERVGVDEASGLVVHPRDVGLELRRPRPATAPGRRS